jgi:hypothetical protein
MTPPVDNVHNLEREENYRRYRAFPNGRHRRWICRETSMACLGISRLAPNTF